MPQTNDHMGAYNFHIEISGVTVGYAKQVQGLEGAAKPTAPGGNVLGARSPVSIAGAGAPFNGQYFVNKVTHNVGGSQSGPPGGSLVPSQVKVIVLGVLPTDQRGATELSRWLGEKSSPQLGRRSVAIIQRDPSGRELRRYSMDGWLVAWQGPPPVPGRPDPPPETARVEIATANLRLGK